MRVFMCCVCLCGVCTVCVDMCVVCWWRVHGCAGKANDQRNREREVFDLLSNFKWVNSQTLNG